MQIDVLQKLKALREHIQKEIDDLPGLHLKWVKGRPYVYSSKRENGRTVTRYWAPLFPKETNREIPPNLKVILARYHSTTAYKRVLRERLRRIDRAIKKLEEGKNEQLDG